MPKQMPTKTIHYMWFTQMARIWTVTLEYMNFELAENTEFECAGTHTHNNIYWNGWLKLFTTGQIYTCKTLFAKSIFIPNGLANKMGTNCKSFILLHKTVCISNIHCDSIVHIQFCVCFSICITFWLIPGKIECEMLNKHI